MSWRELTEYCAAQVGVEAQQAAFAALIPPARPKLTREQRALFRRGGVEALVSAGEADVAAAQSEYIVAHATFCKAQEAASAALRTAKTLADYDAKLAAAQDRQAEILAMGSVQRALCADEEQALHEALGNYSVRPLEED